MSRKKKVITSFVQVKGGDKMISPGTRQQIKELLSEEGYTVKGVAKLFHMTPKTVRRIRDDKAGHQGRKGDWGGARNPDLLTR